ncbi:NAD(P)-dependent oxidoreductase [Jeotgalibacillus alimentarius]|uniref:NAD(P)-dependent oxidoreductase n=1 Tax=Jeotgalibacillus alimentarius TaxID=135826 RepID=A0A0C2RP64_9BACL|nr:NAD(P)-dependent oxidoreductase [Jeotgalibacillus alimentarius]KIL43544.1 NAD(P)-dependent oxidoreductase [Jeotgalibacillus alimentarius]
MYLQTRVGIAGTGFIASGLIRALHLQKDMTVTSVLTRRNLNDFHSFPYQDKLTNEIDRLVASSDLIVECSGDPIYGTEVVLRAFAAGLPVVTMNAELHVTSGSYLSERGFITEAEGDQPGCIAALREDIIQMGFKPLVYGNIKGFINLNPEREEMMYWSKRNNLSLPKVTSFTDGTKVQIEQALISNGLAADIYQDGLLGPSAEDIKSGGEYLAEKAKQHGAPISDYVLCPKGPAGVFITAEHEEDQQGALEYLKLGPGPFYTLVQNYHLCHLEIVKTIRRVMNGGGVLLNNSSLPSVSVGSIAKRAISKGEKIQSANGSFDIRGEAVRIKDHEGHLPIGLFENAVLLNDIEEGQLITMKDVYIEETTALNAWLETEKKVLNQYKAASK